MPTYQIKAPNGKTYRIQGPDGATDEQIRSEVLRQFPDAGGEPDYDDLPVADARQALERGEARLRERTSGMSTEERRRTRRRYEANPRIKALRDRADDFSVGTAASDLGGAAANVAARGVQGAISPYTLLEDTAQLAQRGVNYGVGKAGSGLLGAFGLNDAARWWERGADLVDQDIAERPTVHNIIDQAVPRPTNTAGQAAGLVAEFLGGAMIPMPKSAPRPTMPVAAAPATAADDLVRQGQRAGVRVMTSDARPPKTFIGKTAQAIGERIPIVGTGGPRAAQQAQRLEAARTLLRDYGGDDVVQLFDDAPSALDDVARSLTAQRGRELTRLTRAKQAVISKLDGDVPVPRALAAIDERMAELRRLGMPEIEPVIAKLEGWRTGLQGKRLVDIEDIRRLMGEAFDDPGLASVKSVGQKAVNSIYGPLREDMATFISQRGSKADYSAWAGANERLAAMAGELDSATFKNVLKNSDMTPEAVGRLLFSRNRSDVARLYGNLDAQGKARAQAAVLQRAFDKAISADQGLSAERFVNNLSQLGSSVGVVFQGDDLLRVQGLSRVLDATRRAATAAAAPPTGVQNTPVLGGYALGALFGKAAIPVAAAGGVLARAYESAPVRNLLLRIGKTKPGSAAEGKLMGQVSRIIASAAMTQRQRIGAAANESLPAALAAQEQEDDRDQ